MTHRRVVRWSLCVGFALGAGAIPIAYAVGPSSHGGGALGAEVRLHALPTGELDVTPAEVLSRSGMSPGDEVTGASQVRNLTGVPMTLWLRARPSSPALDRSLRVRIRFGGRLRYDGDLEGLRDRLVWFTLASGEEGRLRVVASLPPGIEDGWRGQSADVALALEPTPLLTSRLPRG